MTVNERYNGIIKMRASEIFAERKPWMRETEDQIFARLVGEENQSVAFFRKQLEDQPMEALQKAMESAKAKIAKIEAGEFIDNSAFLVFFRRAIALKQELASRN